MKKAILITLTLAALGAAGAVFVKSGHCAWLERAAEIAERTGDDRVTDKDSLVGTCYTIALKIRKELGDK